MPIEGEGTITVRQHLKVESAILPYIIDKNMTDIDMI